MCQSWQHVRVPGSLQVACTRRALGVPLAAGSATTACCLRHNSLLCHRTVPGLQPFNSQEEAVGELSMHQVRVPAALPARPAPLTAAQISADLAAASAAFAPSRAWPGPHARRPASAASGASRREGPSLRLAMPLPGPPTALWLPTQPPKPPGCGHCRSGRASLGKCCCSTLTCGWRSSYGSRVRRGSASCNAPASASRRSANRASR